MANYVNTKKTALYLVSGNTLPVPPANFIEQTEEFAVNPTRTMEKFKRISSLLGGEDAYVDNCSAALEQSVSTQMRTNNKDGSALSTPPLYGELLKVCGFNETVGADAIEYANTQSPQRGSAIFNVDGNQFEATDSVVGSVEFVFEAGKPAIINAELSMFLDNEGIPTKTASVNTPLSNEDLIMVSCNDKIQIAGNDINADKVTLKLNSEISTKYGVGIKSKDITDYGVEIKISNFATQADYITTLEALKDQTEVAFMAIFGTKGTGAAIDGQSVEVAAGNCRYIEVDDSTEDGNIKRDITLMVRPAFSDGTSVMLTVGKLI